MKKNTTHNMTFAGVYIEMLCKLPERSVKKNKNRKMRKPETKKKLAHNVNCACNHCKPNAIFT